MATKKLPLESGPRPDALKRTEENRVGRDRARAILQSLHRAQRDLVTDPSPHISAICPRRAGKSYAAAAAALITGEAKPGSISLIISLNLRQLKRLYWAGGPSGLFSLNRKFGLGLKFNNVDLRWEHENGSLGYLLGAEEVDQREVIRGLEADLYVVDECKSFAPDALSDLIDDVIDPQRATRRGRLILIGTPGSVLSGPFYEATCPESHDTDGRPHRIPAGTKDPWGRTAADHLLWSAHSWTLEANLAAPHQWTEALRKKTAKKWSDDDPRWKREYLGEWTNTSDGSVYRYFDEKRVNPPGHVTWDPQPTDENPTGLPEEGAPWNLIAGADLGFEEPTAIVLAGYSRKLGELRHVWDMSESHMLVEDVAEVLREMIRRFGPVEAIHADVGNLGKMVVETLKKHGFPLERAEKREKYDYIELVNDAFHRGEIKIVPGTVLEHQLITNAWALGDTSVAKLARAGRLVEDKSVPNDSADAFLYMWRGAHHRWLNSSAEPAPEYGTEEWFAQWEKDQLRRARREESMTRDQQMLRRRASAPPALAAALTPARQRARW